MYRILVADDEGIMLEAFKNVISGTFEMILCFIGYAKMKKVENVSTAA